MLLVSIVERQRREKDFFVSIRTGCHTENEGLFSGSADSDERTGFVNPKVDGKGTEFKIAGNGGRNRQTSRRRPRLRLKVSKMSQARRLSPSGRGGGISRNDAEASRPRSGANRCLPLASRGYRVHERRLVRVRRRDCTARWRSSHQSRQGVRRELVRELSGVRREGGSAADERSHGRSNVRDRRRDARRDPESVGCGSGTRRDGREASRPEDDDR